jgi:hypothetical protein
MGRWASGRPEASSRRPRPHHAAGTIGSPTCWMPCRRSPRRRREPASGPCRPRTRTPPAKSCGRHATSGYRPLAPQAVARVGGEWERLVTCSPVPREHWRHLRTTNVVASPCAAVRRRTTAATRVKQIDSATAMIWKVRRIVETTVRCVHAPEFLPAVSAGVNSGDGIKQIAVTHQEIAA